MRAKEISFEAVPSKRRMVDCENQDERREAWRIYQQRRTYIITVRIFVRIMKYVVIEQRARKIKRSTQVPSPAVVIRRVIGMGLKGIQNIDDEL